MCSWMPWVCLVVDQDLQLIRDTGLQVTNLLYLPAIMNLEWNDMILGWVPFTYYIILYPASWMISLYILQNSLSYFLDDFPLHITDFCILLLGRFPFAYYRILYPTYWMISLYTLQNFVSYFLDDFPLHITEFCILLLRWFPFTYYRILYPSCWMISFYISQNSVSNKSI